MLRSSRRRRSSAAQQMGAAEERSRRRNSTRQSIGSNSQNIAEDGKAEDVSPTENKTGEKEDKDMEGLTDAMSSLKFVPPSVRFGRGRGRGRGGFARS